MRTEKTKETGRNWLLRTMILMVFMLCFSSSVFATDKRDPEDIQCGADVYAHLDLDGTLYIYGTGAMNNYTAANSSGHFYGNGPFDGIANKISSVVVEAGVTSVGNYAFCKNNRYFSSLTSVTISDTVKTIGESSFCDCDSLQKVTLGAQVQTIGAYAFADCDYLYTINFPTGLQEIGYRAFYSCDNLGTIMLTLPDTLVKIDDYAFCDCAITSINFPVSVKYIGEFAFDDNRLSAMIPRKESMFIGAAAFYNSTIHGYPGTYVEQWCKANQSNTFAPIPTQITLEGNGGTIHGSATYSIEEVCGTYFSNLPDGTAMSQPGYIFIGWFTLPEGGDAVTDSSIVNTTDAFSLYAHWEVDTTPPEPVVKPTTPTKITVKPEIKKAEALKQAKIRFTWKKKSVKGANSIEIQYSTNKKFKGKAVYKRKVNLSKTNYTLTKLAKNKTYYIRIRYVGTKTNSPWSKTVKVKTLKK